jgi:hypothetical protein
MYETTKVTLSRFRLETQVSQSKEMIQLVVDHSVLGTTATILDQNGKLDTGVAASGEHQVK